MSLRSQHAATLVEIVVAAGVALTLAAFTLTALRNLQDQRERLRCLSTMRQLALGVLSFAAEKGGQLPRSNHSAAAAGERGWQREILPYLGYDRDVPLARFRELQARHFRCPADRKRTTGTSYGLNVFFELDPGFDDYEGAPQTWRTLASLPRAARTILLAEVPEQADHVMAHFWGGGGFGGDVASTRHTGRSHYAFADGHIELLPVEKTFAPSQAVNLWNPGLAR